ncbi:hypothetical protein NL676_007240 [Syzygium grande]|nr:hypothetical protein NL676_007240 [Syzygium grande]
MVMGREPTSPRSGRAGVEGLDLGVHDAGAGAGGGGGAAREEAEREAKGEGRSRVFAAKLGPVEEDEEALIDPNDRDDGSADRCLDYEEYLQMLFDRETGYGFKRDEGVDSGSGFGMLARFYLHHCGKITQGASTEHGRPKVSRA